MALFQVARHLAEGAIGDMRRTVIGVAASVASAALLYFATDWSRSLPILRSANWALIAVAIMCLGASLAAKTLRWRLLLPRAAGLSTPGLFRILHISFLLNNVLPARVGDVARVAMTSRQPGVRVGHVLSSLVIERVADAAVLIGCFMVISPFLPLPDSHERWLTYAWAGVLFCALLAVAAVVSRRGLARIVRSPAVQRRIPAREMIRLELASFAEGFRALLSRRDAIRIWGWSLAAWAGAFAINYVLMLAIGIHAPITAAVLLTCTTNLAMLVPSSPGYIGVFHAAATLSLLPFDVSAPLALSFAVLAHLVNVLPVSLLGVAFLIWGRETLGPAKPTQAAAEPGAA